MASTPRSAQEVKERKLTAPDSPLYLAACLLLDKCSNETALIQRSVQRYATNRSLVCNYMLDVGCGHGRLFDLMGFKDRPDQKQWERLEFVESAPLQYDLAHSKVSTEKLAKVFRGHYGDARNMHYLARGTMENRPRIFDVILLSHMLYHIPFKEIGSFIDKHLGLLRPGGVLIIILWNSMSKIYQFVLKETNRQDLALGDLVYENITKKNFLSTPLSNLEIEEPAVIFPRIRITREENVDVLRAFFVRSLSWPLPSPDFGRITSPDGLENSQSLLFISRK